MRHPTAVVDDTVVPLDHIALFGDAAAVQMIKCYWIMQRSFSDTAVLGNAGSWPLAMW